MCLNEWMDGWMGVWDGNYYALENEINVTANYFFNYHFTLRMFDGTIRPFNADIQIQL